MGAAALLFAESGFHNVTMNQIAENVGITAGALYRHFAGKAELLNAVLTSYFDRVTAPASHTASLNDLLQARAAAAAELPALGVLWSRESRHLRPEDRKRLVRRVQAENTDFAAALRSERPDLSADHASILAWALQSILASTSGHVRGISARGYGKVMLAACQAVAAQELDSAGPSQARSSAGIPPTTKRENLLDVAGRLFGAHGYEGTSLSDIGAAAGVSGPSLYTHFASKADLLAAVLERADHALWLDLHTALSTSLTATEALERVIASYVSLSRSQQYVIAVLVADQNMLPEESHRRQVDYLQEWVSLVLRIRPDLDPAAAHVLVRAAINTINDLSRTGGAAARPGVAANLATVALAIVNAQV